MIQRLAGLRLGWLLKSACPAAQRYVPPAAVPHGYNHYTAKQLRVPSTGASREDGGDLRPNIFHALLVPGILRSGVTWIATLRLQRQKKISEHLRGRITTRISIGQTTAPIS
ncbi:MAG: hypothetical protein GY934_08590 [Gammaproteobacteria bacterium]|nr:hypothetical protein [Gammaproteobacteria bacterium]